MPVFQTTLLLRFVPTPSPLHGRAQRASRNYKENYPVFMALGILALVVPEADMGLAVMGAMTFVLARLIYLPLYLAAIPALRSTAFTVGWLGMIAMGWALVSG